MLSARRSDQNVAILPGLCGLPSMLVLLAAFGGSKGEF
jgi:hypothetical protein